MIYRLAWILTATATTLFPTLAMAQRDLKNIPVPDPAEEQKTFVVADGFEVNLFAADPLIHKPIQINFDPQGRLWVAASEVYPQIAPGQVANDKILILEDANGDGVADKTTVFADGLLIPTGVAPGDGGAYVANSTELLHLADTNGDGKADRSKIVLSGFGTEDTHHIIHTFRWGPEGLFYFNQSIYIHSHVETPYGVKRLNAGGIWQFRPETLELNVFARGWVNTWGHAFDRWGQSFATDGAGGEGINYVVPGAAYPTAFGVPEILHGLNPGSPKYCGLEVVDGRHLPDDWQGNLITHDFRGHRVCRFAISDDGSGFAARQQPDLISSNHVAFRPIDVKQGPDGAIYIADWYNPIIQHGEVDFRDERRDHTHGRIWRVTAKGRPLSPRPNFTASATIPQLLDHLKSPETFARQEAKRTLKSRSKDDVVAALDAWVKVLNPQDPEFEHQRVEALWVYQSFAAVRPELLKAVLASPEPRARAAAVRIVPHWAGQLDQPAELLAAAVHDEFPRVRLEAVRSLSALPSQRSAELAMAAVDHPLDNFLAYALRQTARELKPYWATAASEGRFNDEGHFDRLLFAIEATQATELIPLTVQRWQSGQLAPKFRSRVLELVGSLGAPEHLRLVFDRAVATGTSPEESADLLQALLEAQQKRKVQPSGDLAAVSQFLDGNSPRLMTLGLDAIGRWGLRNELPKVAAIATSEQQSDANRQTAIQALAQLGGDPAWAALSSLVTTNVSESISAGALSALISRQTGRAIPLTVTWLTKSKTPDAQATVFNAYLQTKGAPALLAKALEGQKLPEDAAKIGLRTVTGAGRQEPELIAALTKAGNVVAGPRVLSPEEMTAMLQDVAKLGDAARGEALFRREDLACFKCHAIGGAGGRVGPDLASIGASAQPDYLVDSLLQPSKNVKENYHSVVVQTDAGKVLTGIKVRESETELIIRDTEDQEVIIPRKTIDEMTAGTSLMPAGLTEKLTRGELADLVRFLSELGKPGAYAVGTAQVARRWEALLPTKESWTRLTRTSDAQLMSSDETLTWQPRYARVSGGLPLGELPVFEPQNKLVESARRISFVRASIQVTTGGDFTFGLNDTAGLQIWIDGRPIDQASILKTRLEPGLHRLAFAIDLKQRQQPLRVELLPTPNQASQGQFVTGK